MCLEVYQVDGVLVFGIYDHNHFVIKVWQIHLQFIKGADMSINNYLVIMLTIANAVIWTWALMEIL
jgi:hypothetical protein